MKRGLATTFGAETSNLLNFELDARKMFAASPVEPQVLVSKNIKYLTISGNFTTNVENKKLELVEFKDPVLLKEAALWFDPVFQVSRLVILVDSAELVQRKADLIEHLGVVDMYQGHPHFIYLEVISQIPNMQSTIRGYLNAYIDNFQDQWAEKTLDIKQEKIATFEW